MTSLYSKIACTDKYQYSSEIVLHATEFSKVFKVTYKMYRSEYKMPGNPAGGIFATELEVERIQLSFKHEPSLNEVVDIISKMSSN